MGEYLYQEINQKLQANVNIGHENDNVPNLFHMETWSLPYTILQCLLPEWMGKKTDYSVAAIINMVKVELLNNYYELTINNLATYIAS